MRARRMRTHDDRYDREQNSERYSRVPRRNPQDQLPTITWVRGGTSHAPHLKTDRRLLLRRCGRGRRRRSSLLPLHPETTPHSPSPAAGHATSAAATTHEATASALADGRAGDIANAVLVLVVPGIGSATAPASHDLAVRCGCVLSRHKRRAAENQCRGDYRNPFHDQPPVICLCTVPTIRQVILNLLITIHNLDPARKSCTPASRNAQAMHLTPKCDYIIHSASGSSTAAQREASGRLARLRASLCPVTIARGEPLRPCPASCWVSNEF